jgi:hypothetical protein
MRVKEERGRGRRSLLQTSSAGDGHDGEKRAKNWLTFRLAKTIEIRSPSPSLSTLSRLDLPPSDFFFK